MITTHKSNNRIVLDYLYEAGPCLLDQMKKELTGQVEASLISAILSRYRTTGKVTKAGNLWNLLPGARSELRQELEAPPDVVSARTVNIWTKPMVNYEANMRAAANRRLA